MDWFDHWVVQIQIKLSYIKIKDIEIRKVILAIFFICDVSFVMFMYYIPTIQVLAILGILLITCLYLTVVWIKSWPVASEMLKRAENSEKYGTYKRDVNTYYPDFGKKYR